VRINGVKVTAEWKSSEQGTDKKRRGSWLQLPFKIWLCKKYRNLASSIDERNIQLETAQSEKYARWTSSQQLPSLDTLTSADVRWCK